MELQVCSLFGLVLIVNSLLVCCQGAGNKKFDPSSFDINTNTNTENGKCVRRITVKGNGVTDTIRTGCTDNGVNILKQDGVMVYGQPPKDSFYMYSDAFHTLVVIEDKQCTKKTYGPGNRRRIRMSPDACAAVMKKIETMAGSGTYDLSSDNVEGSDVEAMSSGTGVVPVVNNIGPTAQQPEFASGTGQADPTNFLISSNIFTMNGRCVNILSVEGILVSDVFQTDCSNHGFSVLRQSGSIVYGRPQTDNFSLFCDAVDSVVVIENGRCTRKTYSRTGEAPTISSLSDAECAAVKKRAADLYAESNQGLAFKLENAVLRLPEELQNIIKHLKQ